MATRTRPAAANRIGPVPDCGPMNGVMTDTMCEAPSLAGTADHIAANLTMADDLLDRFEDVLRGPSPGKNASPPTSAGLMGSLGGSAERSAGLCERLKLLLAVVGGNR